MIVTDTLYSNEYEQGEGPSSFRFQFSSHWRDVQELPLGMLDSHFLILFLEQIAIGAR